MKKDELFQNSEYGTHDFEFNQDVARVFDDMVMRSIPHYQILQDYLINSINIRKRGRIKWH